MKDIMWLINRTKKMSIPELVWRVQQKFLQKIEYKNIYCLHLPATKISAAGYKAVKSDPKRLVLNTNNQNYTVFENLDIFEKFNYQKFKKNWNAGFQTSNIWPEKDYSYTISIGQREDIGDIRTNWELNRHYQFVCLAKNYYVTLNEKYLKELTELFEDWNVHNLFLHGAEWTSTMEVAIRTVSWIYVYAFISVAAEKNESDCTFFLDELSHGIYIMADYILKHRAKYSSANNHLIVEMFGVAMAGIFFDKKKWVNTALKVLTNELPKQNSNDGVNKEMSLHYQSFVMEAYGILLIHLEKNNITVPRKWRTYLSSLSKFVADCCGSYGEVVAFGDNDEGKLLDFSGNMKDHYRYVLQLMGMILDKNYTDFPLNENIYWLFDSDMIEKYKHNELYRSAPVCCYKEGGYTLLRSTDKKVLIGFDHANLGFGRIAAHGHADALSIQMYYCGEPILIDSGTFNYHVPPNARDKFRSTRAHNTVYINDIEQAEMQGPFLWGNRYKCFLQSLESKQDSVDIVGCVEYAQVKHIRRIRYGYSSEIEISDEISTSSNVAYQLWHFGGKFKEVHGYENNLESNGTKITIVTDSTIIDKQDCTYSDRYNMKKKGILVSLKMGQAGRTTKFLVEDKEI